MRYDRARRHPSPTIAGDIMKLDIRARDSQAGTIVSLIQKSRGAEITSERRLSAGISRVPKYRYWMICTGALWIVMALAAAAANAQSPADGFDAAAIGTRALAVQSDGKIVVGGSFTLMGGGGLATTTRNYIGRFNADGRLDTSFDPGPIIGSTTPCPGSLTSRAGCG